jgi:hypothetical protein
MTKIEMASKFWTDLHIAGGEDGGPTRLLAEHFHWATHAVTT